MANTGNTQQQINYGSAPNDGLGDPLRTAFIKTDENFDNIWLAGPVGSNITIANNAIQVNDTNGNLVLQPNGVGIIQANAHVIPSANNVRDLGSSASAWRRAYINTLNIRELEVPGNAVVSGNLTVQGNIIQVGNIITDSLTIQLANTAATDAQADGAGVTVGANDDIATLLYDSTTDQWVTNIGIDVPSIVVNSISSEDSSFVTVQDGLTIDGVLDVAGTVSATYFVGNGSQLTGITSYGNADVAAYLPTYTGNLAGGNLVITDNGAAWTIAGRRITGPGGAYWLSNPAQSTDEFVSAPGEFLTLKAIDSNLVTQGQLFLGNTYTEILVENGVNRRWRFKEDGVTEVPGCLTPVVAAGGCANIGNATNPWANGYFSGTIFSGDIIPQANVTYSLGNSTNYWSNIWVASNTIYIGGVALGVTGNTLTVAGEPVLANDGSDSITTTGDLSVSNITASGTANINGEVIGQYFTLRGPNPTGTIGTVGYGGNVVVLNGFEGVQIESGPDEGSPAWTFSTNGNLTAPGNITTTGNVSAGNILTDNYFYANGAPFVSSSTGDITFTNTTMSPPDGEDLFITAANSEVEITGLDFRVEVTDDVRITGNDLVSIRNTSDAEPITIITDYNGAERTWEFDATGDLTTPGDITVGGDITGASGGGTLVLKAQTDSNTYIQLNNTVDSTINTVANLEISTDVSNTARTWTFDTTGDFTAPGNITAANFIGDVAAANVTGLANVATTGSYTDLSDTPALANVATTGSYTDLSNKPTIPSLGNFSLTNNTILTGDGSIPLTLSIFGADGADPPALISKDWYFANTGAFTSPGNITGTNLITAGNVTAGNVLTDNYFYANGDPFVSSNYGDSNVVTLLSAFGSNTITTTGNITAANFEGNISITGNVTGTSANVDLIAGSYQWSFDNTGNLVLPGNTFAVNYANGAVVSLGGSYGNADVEAYLPTYTGNLSPGNILTDNYFYANGDPFVSSDYGDSNVVTLLSSFGSNTITTTGNITAGNVSTTGLVDSYDINAANSITVGNDLSVTGDISGAYVSATGNIAGGNLIVTGTVYGQVANAVTGFETAGYVTAAGNVTGGNLISTNTIFGNPDIVLGNVADAAATKTRIVTDTTFSYIQTGNGTVGSTGNIVFSPYSSATQKVVIDTGSGDLTAAGNITADNVSLSGNITGAAANVTITANSFVTTFDTTGTATFPGAVQLAVYANTTVRDAAISSPVPGMMIYVTDTGMQVRGATQWNTISGSGT